MGCALQFLDVVPLEKRTLIETISPFVLNIRFHTLFTLRSKSRFLDPQ